MASECSGVVIGWQSTAMWFLGLTLAGSNQRDPGFPRNPRYGLSMEFCPFYDIHLRDPETRECWEKRAVPWVDDGPLSWFLFDVRKQSTEHQWRL